MTLCHCHARRRFDRVQLGLRRGGYRLDLTERRGVADLTQEHADLSASEALALVARVRHLLHGTRPEIARSVPPSGDPVALALWAEAAKVQLSS